MGKTKAKAKFNGGLKIKHGVTQPTTMVISKDNPNQEGDNFRAFIELVEKEPRITQVRIIVSCHLNRHYINEDAARAWGDTWVEANEPILKASKKPYQIIRWPEMLNHPEYQSNFSKVTNYYANDEQFRATVNSLAIENSLKKEVSTADAINYTLEEDAVSLLIDGHEMYPAEALNEAIAAVVKHFKCPKRYNGYKVGESLRKSKQVDTDGQLIVNCLNLSFTLEKRYGIRDPENQARLFKNILNMVTSIQECEQGGSTSPKSDSEIGNSSHDKDMDGDVSEQSYSSSAPF